MPDFINRIIARFIQKKAKKKLGKNLHLDISDLQIEEKNGIIALDIKAHAEISRKDFMDLIKDYL